MLRIYIHDEVPVTSFVLEGKLVGPWVEELEKGWESTLAANLRACRDACLYLLMLSGL